MLVAEDPPDRFVCRPSRVANSVPNPPQKWAFGSTTWIVSAFQLCSLYCGCSPFCLLPIWAKTPNRLTSNGGSASFVGVVSDCCRHYCRNVRSLNFDREPPCSIPSSIWKPMGFYTLGQHLQHYYSCQLLVVVVAWMHNDRRNLSSHRYAYG